jgi:hypothetical protein
MGGDLAGCNSLPIALGVIAIEGRFALEPGILICLVLALLEQPSRTFAKVS